MSDRNKKIGAFGEELAADFLFRRGFSILGWHYRTRHGEVDLIGELDGQIIFFEVKTRTSDEYGLPEEAIGHRKQVKLIETAKQYLSEKDINTDDYRIDSIAVVIDRQSKTARIRHTANIVADIYNGRGYS